MTDSSDICNQLYALARERNGEDVVLEFNGVPVLVVQRHESADHVLRLNAAGYRKNMDWFRQALGASRFSEEGERWEVRRDLTQAYFSHFDREHACALARRHAAATVDRLIADSARDAQVLDDQALREMTVSILVENFFGIAFAQTGIDLRAMAQLMEYGSAYSFVPPGGTGSLYRDALQRLPGLRREVLRELRPFRDGRVPAASLLSGMLASDADPSNDVVLEHELVTFLAAGAESSAATLGWACYLLARHPEAQATLRAQLADIDPADGWAALARCEALADFASEALRLYPSTPIISRVALAADRIGSHGVEAGQIVMLSLIGIGHDARLRADPWALGGSASRRGATAGSQMAFGVGPRVCGGKQFALLELMAALAVFITRARFELTSTEPPRFRWKVQMLRDGGHPVRVLPLQPSL